LLLLLEVRPRLLLLLPSWRLTWHKAAGVRVKPLLLWRCKTLP
jgi:hypothetical protein